MTLAQRFKVIRQLGQGGSARVYLVYDEKDGRNRALKEVPRGGRKQELALGRREAELAWKLKYPYFPQIFEVLETKEADYLVMEYLEGETLGSRLLRLGPQPVSDVLRWGKDLCLMLSYLHRGNPPVIYQDMKPDNVMVQRAGNLRLIDFGAALELPEDRGKKGLRMGTRGYAAPEQFDQEKAIDARTDIYGLGVTMYQLLTGMDPRLACPEEFALRRVRRFTPRRLDLAIRKCTRRDPKERYQSCEELREDLKRI